MMRENQDVLTTGKELEEAEKAVILVHGRGATAHSMIQLTNHLSEAAYLAPQAANRSWYPRPFMAPIDENQPHLDSALEKLGSLVEEATKQLGQENVVLLGFSQGACLVAEYAARNPRLYGGIIAFSGGLIGEELADFEGDMRKTPLFLGCAENDSHIPIERVDETEKVFKELGAEVEKYVFEGSYHGIVDYELERAKEIIEKLS